MHQVLLVSCQKSAVSCCLQISNSSLWRKICQLVPVVLATVPVSALENLPRCN